MFFIRVIIILVLFGLARLFDFLNIGALSALCFIGMIIMAIITLFKLFNGD